MFDFIETIDKEEISVLIGSETREMYLPLDAKLFSVLVEAVSGKAHLKHAQTIELEIPMGKGRGALKIIDKAKMFEIDELVTRASNRLTNTSCCKNSELEAFIINLKYEQRVLEISGSKMPEPISVKLLKNAVKEAETKLMALREEFEQFEKSQATQYGF